MKGIAQSIVGKVEIQLKENSVTDLFILAFSSCARDLLWREELILLGKRFSVTTQPVSNSVWPHKGQG